MLINARKLNEILLNTDNFKRWIERKIKQENLLENVDYFVKEVKIKCTSKINKKRMDYYLTEETAKKIISSQIKSKKSKDIRKKLEEGLTIEKILEEMIENPEKQIRVIKITDKEYPEQLKMIKNPPHQLYVKGNMENLRKYGIAVIGSRNCSNYGRQICKIFTNNLVGYGLNIISGLAVGIDACAHKACLEAGGKTIAVLPSGFNNIYPKENKDLVDKIIEKGGTVVTEYPPDTEKTQETCRQRNRIMSGLAIGTLVIEAEIVSGTSITVRHTNEQNKKAFCVPASILNSKGVGTNKMIKENKAKMVTEVDDIIKEYPELKLSKKANFNFLKVRQKEKAKEKSKKKKEEIQIDEENLDVYNILSKDPKEIDEIAIELNQPTQQVAYKLTMLQLQGVIEEVPGKKFKIK